MRADVTSGPYCDKCLCEVVSVIAGMCYECAEAEIAELRNRVIEIHTMTECANCKRRVRPRYAIHGLCTICARAEIAELRDDLRGLQARYDGSQRALTKLLAEHTFLSEEAERLRAGITAKIVAVRDAEREIVRLRGIEAAALHGQSRADLTGK